MFHGRAEHALLKRGRKNSGTGKTGGIGNRATSGHYTVSIQIYNKIQNLPPHTLWTLATGLLSQAAFQS
jgi:hypothetical protein